MLNTKKYNKKLKQKVVNYEWEIFKIKESRRELQEKVLNYEWEVFRQKFSNSKTDRT